MTKITKEQIIEDLRLHKLWLLDNSKGKCICWSYADLRGADLSYAILRSADLNYVDLRDADLSYADLEDSYLSYVNLSGADLSYADLNGADLCRTVFRGANLSDVDLRGADLHAAKGISSFYPVGSRRRTGYAVKHANCIMIQLGCFWGSSEEAIRKVSEKYGADSSYVDFIKAAVKTLKEVKS